MAGLLSIGEVPSKSYASKNYLSNSKSLYSIGGEVGSVAIEQSG
jgi:hypothetical protein